MNTTGIYMDHASTTYVDPEVLKAMLPYFDRKYGNAETAHQKGREALVAIDTARKTIAKILNCSPIEIVFTGTGTEANNLAIFGAARANKDSGKHVITTKIEHSSVLEPFKQLEKEGFEVTFLDVDEEGFVNIDELKKSLRPDTIFVSIMYANNEIGTIEPIREIGEILGKHTALFHTDACQAQGVETLDTQALRVDLMTLNASKVYGPKGVGALYIKRGIALKPLICGGTHENNLRAGTHNTPGIVGLAKALELADKNREKENARLTILRDRLIKALLEGIPNARLNGPLPSGSNKRLPNNVSISIKDASSRDILLKLDQAGICATKGSACKTGKDEPSQVQKAIKIPEEFVNGTIRITLGKRTTEKDVNYTIKTLTNLTKHENT